MKNKIKLLALVYGPEDKQAMNNWLETHAGSFEVVYWSENLQVPIQAAVAHFANNDENFYDFDGLLIDDHYQYDPIVIQQMALLLKLNKVNLYSASNGISPVIGSTSPRAIVQANKMAFPDALHTIQRIAV